MKSRATMALLSLFGGAVLMSACDSATAPRSNLRSAGLVSADKASADDADACKKGGFANYTRTDGTLFKNQGDCVSYVVQGGQLLPKLPPLALPVIASFTFGGFVDRCSEGIGFDVLLTGVFNGGTGTITDPTGAVTPITSGGQVQLPGRPGVYTLTVTNAAGSATSTVDPFQAGVPQCGGGADFNRTPGGKGRIGTG